MRADRRDPIIKTLRRFKPTRFEATLRDGEKKTIALSTKQNRWELLSDTLAAMPWVSIEALDEKGAVLGAVEREADDVEEYDDDDVDKGDRLLSSLARIVHQVQRETMKECRLMFADSMKSHAEMASAMLDSNRVLAENYQLAMKVQQMAFVNAQGGDADKQEGDKLFEMFKMAMMLQSGAKPTVTVSATPPPKPIANGAPKKS